MSIVRLLAAAAMIVAALPPAGAQVSLVARVLRTDSPYPAMVSRARDAQAERRWHDAAQLWQAALLENDDAAEHWESYGLAQFNSAQYREAIASYQRGMQLGARNADDALWNVARSYAQLGNRKQVVRWLEQCLARGVRTRRDVRAEPVFARFARDVGFRALMAEVPTATITADS